MSLAFAQRAMRGLLALPTLAFLVLFFLVPLAMVIVYSFASISLVTYDISFGWTLGNYRQIHDPLYFDTLVRSLVLSVGATGRSDTVTGFSSYGSYLDISAPGVGILSTSWNGGSLGYEYGNGTSFSCRACGA